MNKLRSPFGCIILAFIASAMMMSSFTNSSTPESDVLLAEDTTNVNNKDFYLEMKGNVRKAKENEEDQSKALDSALVSIYSNGIPLSELWTNKKGRCNFKLPLDKVFKIEVSKPGFVSKNFEVSTKIPADKRAAYSFSFDIEIFEEVKNLDVSVLKNPIAKVAYNVIMEQFAYDVRYTSKINLDLKKLYKNYYELQKIEADTALMGAKQGGAPKKVNTGK